MPTMKALSPLDIGHIQVPQHFRCPISLELMKDPVILSTGHTYDRSSIETWIASGNTTCPLTMQPIPLDFNFIPNHTLRRLIQEWCVTNRSKGVERIPTPKQPADPARVSYLLAEATSSTTPLAPIQALRILVSENERNKVVLIDQSAIPILLSLLFSDGVREHPIDLEVVEEALATLVSLPLSARQCADANALLPDKLLFMSSLLHHPRETMRANVAMFLAVLSELPDSRAVMAETDGLIQSLLGLIDQGTSSSSSTLVMAAINCLYSLCLSDTGKQIATPLGAATTLVDYLISAKLADAAKLAEESALGALELLCGTEGGCIAVADHPLAAPALLKFVLKSSERAAEHAMGALLAICHRSETARHNALHAGIVKELLLLMQSSCSSQTKARALDLLKLFRSAWFNNPSWMPADCGRADVVAF